MDDELLAEFVNESREHLTTIETDLLAIEEGGSSVDEQLVNKVFRAAHSIKGGSAFFGLNKIKELAHKAETVLDMLRSRKMSPNAEITNVLLAAFDQLREMINHPPLRETADISDLVVSLTGLASSYLPPDQKASLTAQVSLRPKGLAEVFTLQQVDLDRARRSGQFVYLGQVDLIHDIERKGINILNLFREIAETGEIVDCLLDFDAVGTLDVPVGNQLPLRLVFATIIQPDDIEMLLPIPRDKIKTLADPNQPLAAGAKVLPSPAASAPPAPFASAVVAEPAVPLPPASPVVPPLRAPEEPAGEAPAARPVRPEAANPSETGPGSGAGDNTLRVHVGLLETLMNLAGELVLSRNQLRAAVAQDNRQLLTSVDQRVHQVTSELQDVIMQTRLQPIGNVFSKFPRVVRDLSRSLGKDIQLDIRGKDVALDKTLIEGLSDPLTHMVRNAVDHGIETTEERLRAGKKATGLVRIEARHEAGMVVVEIADDGKGIDPARVTESAVRKGLITAEKARGLSDRDKQALVFLPGLSTAQKVTDVSGRGVGMDVVKTNLDRLGGQVEIVSVVGRGSTFRIKLPLTLAIIPCLIVSVGQERFAIPQANIEELLRLQPEEVGSRISVVGDEEVLLLRDRVLPLARLDRVLGAATAGRGTGADEAPDEALEIAVVTAGTLSCAVVVGGFHDTEEIVVKPLGRRLKHLREYCGATILGDGTVALILDMAGMAAKAGLTAVAESAARTAQAEEQRLQDLHSLLLFHNGAGEPCAVPLDLVQRIERVEPSQVERLGNHRTMQYRGGSLPLVALSDAASVAPMDAAGDLVVLVTSAHGREVGLLGSMPVDVLETQAVIDQSTHRQRGIAGSTILQDRTTLVVDLFELVDAVHPDWRAARAEERAPGTNGSNGSNGGNGAEHRITVLLAEDSDFFRAQVKRYLQEDGIEVLAAPDGEAAWELLLENVARVQVVVSDIEMPRLTGLGLAARIRGDERTSKLPIIAVTSLASDEDVVRGQAAGITEYQVKLDRDKLLSSVHAFAAAGEVAVG